MRELLHVFFSDFSQIPSEIYSVIPSEIFTKSFNIFSKLSVIIVQTIIGRILETILNNISKQTPVELFKGIPENL